MIAFSHMPSIVKSTFLIIQYTKIIVCSLNLFRYAYPWWKEKEIDSEKKRKDGLCPLTPEETALTLRALDIDRNIQVYIAAGDIYKPEKRMASLREAFPNLVGKHNIFRTPINNIWQFIQKEH